MAQLRLFLFALSLLRYVRAYISISGTKFFHRDNGAQFYIKGVVYSEGTGTQNAVLDALADPTQCAHDAPVIKALGANTIRVPFVDPTTDHDGCMKIFADASIYVIVDLAGGTSLKDQTWDQNFFNRYTSVIDTFASYDNLLAVTVGNEVISDSDSTRSAPSLKAAVRDVKAYVAAKEYRKIPVGYATAAVSGIVVPLGDYLVCGGNSTDSADFYGINLFSWCGDSTYTESGYDQYTSELENLPVPIFLSEDGCTTPGEPRTFQDQAAIFGPNMVDIWSGAIIYEWLNDSSGFGLVGYTNNNFLSGTPTTMTDYENLKTQWATLNPQGVKSSDYTFTGGTPACPTTDSVWTVAPSAILPSIAGLNLATVSPTNSPASRSQSRTGSATGTGSSTGAASSSSASGAVSSTTASHKSGLSTGAAAGIGVGAAVVVIALLVFLVLLYRRRKLKQKPAPDGGFDDKAEMYAGPVDPSMSSSVLPKHELPNSNSVQRKPLPGELAATGVAPLHELHGKTSSNAPWAHNTDGYTPAELHPTSIQEAGAGTMRRELGVPPSPTKDEEPDSSANSTAVGSATGSSRPKSMLSSRPDPFPFDDSELAEDADVAVQELGLISVRKRTLVSQANAAGVKPEDIQGRKGEEYRELMERERRVRARLDEIERQRRESQR